MRNVLVTGGAGYIGSHTLIALCEAGYQPLVADDFSNSSPEVMDRVEDLTGESIPLYRIDVTDEASLRRVFQDQSIDAVIHFAGFKAVGESVEKPLEYYENNLVSTLVLCRLMREYGVTRLVFSSSATVYGDPAVVPIPETAPRSAANPYGWSKLMNELMLEDIGRADPSLGIMLLRYFNPIGAHPSGRIGEDPNGIPNNLMPYISQVAIGKLEQLHVFGDDYPTPDGTGVRDYIHVMDLAEGHVAALRYLSDHKGVQAVNLGTGRGYSVLDIRSTFERVNGIEVPYVIDPRRPGDIPTCYADPLLAADLLHWQATRDLEDMCRDSWHWQSQNPDGYGST
ncbi:MAG TPA: UDP-glucose 4-epimerase GalE [Clostridiaceae bacterium]|nr:UDP-glucose 4-epimerase GalE [Clostridiaceae bacterium]